MVGRIPVMDVSPLVDLGRQPAKATVGEPFPGDGHRVPRGPRQASAPRWCSPARTASARAPVRMTKQDGPTRPVRRLGDPRRRGRLDLRGAGLVGPARHLAARRGAQDPRRRRRGADVHRGPAAARAGARRPAPSAADPRPQGAPGRDQGRAGHRAARRGPAGRAAGPRPGSRSCTTTRSASWSPSRARSRRTPTASARSSAAGTSSSRAPRAPPATRRPARSPAAPSAPRRSGSTRWPRWASTSSTCRRSTRSARSTARAPTTP